jgi:hypothetical protein
LRFAGAGLPETGNPSNRRVYPGESGRATGDCPSISREEADRFVRFLEEKLSTSTDLPTGLEPQAFLIAKTDQAIEILKEKGIDVWITYVRESGTNVDPSLELIFEGDLTWESALILTADGEKVALVGIHDAPEVEESGIYTRVIGYREGIS